MYISLYVKLLAFNHEYGSWLDYINLEHNKREKREQNLYLECFNGRMFYIGIRFDNLTRPRKGEGKGWAGTITIHHVTEGYIVCLRGTKIKPDKGELVYVYF